MITFVWKSIHGTRPVPNIVIPIPSTRATIKRKNFASVLPIFFYAPPMPTPAGPFDTTITSSTDFTFL